jgi:hypothetical protein
LGFLPIFRNFFAISLQKSAKTPTFYPKCCYLPNLINVLILFPFCVNCQLQACTKECLLLGVFIVF